MIVDWIAIEIMVLATERLHGMYKSQLDDMVVSAKSSL